MAPASPVVRTALLGRAGVGVIALAMAASACGGLASQTSGALSTPSPRPVIVLSSCTLPPHITARCGALSVLENPADPAGRRIAIHVVVLSTYGPIHAPDPLFYFAGGPGGAASDSVQWASRTFMALNATRDIVFVDQRGTGGSNALTCPALVTAGVGMSGTAPSAASEATAAKACLASIGNAGDPAMYTTPLFADDVDQVRAALGYGSIDVYGGSYGVSSGLTYIQRHGEHVRAAVFDSGSLLDVRLWEGSAASQQASWNPFSPGARPTSRVMRPSRTPPRNCPRSRPA